MPPRLAVACQTCCAITAYPCGKCQVVDGNRLIVTPYDLSFQKEHEHTSLCKKSLEAKEIQQLRKVSCM